MSEPTTPPAPLKVGSPCTSGQKVAVILGQSPKACCYTTEDNNLRWEFYHNNGILLPELSPVVSRFDDLLWQIAAHIPKPFRRTYYHRAGLALFSALDCLDPRQADKFFCPIEAQIRDSKLGMSFYLLAGFSGFIWLSCFIYLLHLAQSSIPSHYLTGAFWGSCGALASLLQRAGTLEAFPNAIRLVLVMQGASRVFLGFIFGAALCLFMQGGLVLGFAGGNQETALALSFLAGVSERFFPEIANAVSTRVAKENSS